MPDKKTPTPEWRAKHLKPAPTLADVVTMYITKWCLTRGIITATGRVDGGYFICRPPGKFELYLEIGVDAWDTPPQATVDAIGRAKRKAASLRKSLDKITPLTENPKWCKKTICPPTK